MAFFNGRRFVTPRTYSSEIKPATLLPSLDGVWRRCVSKSRAEMRNGRFPDFRSVYGQANKIRGSTLRKSFMAPIHWTKTAAATWARGRLARRASGRSSVRAGPPSNRWPPPSTSPSRSRETKGPYKPPNKALALSRHNLSSRKLARQVEGSVAAIPCPTGFTTTDGQRRIGFCHADSMRARSSVGRARHF